MLDGEQNLKILNTMRIIRQNLDVTHLDDVSVIYKHATPAIWQEMQDRAIKKGIFESDGVDRNGVCYFKARLHDGTRYKYMYVY